MRIGQIVYPLCILVLSLAYYVVMDSGGYRLPRYVTPGGAVLPLGPGANDFRTRRFFEIDGSDPAARNAIFSSSDPVMVHSDAGTGFMRLVENHRWRVALDFKWFILFSFIYVVCAAWFLQSANDIHLAALCFFLAVFNFSFVAVTAYHDLELLFQISGLALPLALFNMGLRTTGKEVSGYLIVGEVIVFLFLSLIAYVGRENAETIINITQLGLFAFLAALTAVVALQLENALRSTEDRVEKFKRWVLFLGTLFGFFLPLSWVALGFRGFDFGVPLDYVIFTGVIFPVALIYSTYRLHIIPFQFVLTHSITATLATTLFVSIYGVVLLSHSILLPEQEARYQWIVNLVFILILVFFLDPARRALSTFFEKRIFRPDARLADSLKRMAGLLSSNRRIQPAAHAFLDEVQETLDLEKVSFLMSGPAFVGFRLRRSRLARISRDSSIWRYITPERLVVTAYLTYAGGRREELFHYLYKNRVMLAIGIVGRGRRRLGRRLGLTALPWRGNESAENEEPAGDDGVRVALMVGYRRSGQKLELREIRYLQEAAKLVGMLIYNYTLLMGEIEKRRRIRELVIAGHVQRSMPGPEDQSFNDVRLAYFNHPAISVTGDYLDLIRLSQRRFAFFLGDVSGHGLGTGYLVSSVRAIARAHLENGADLPETLAVMNSFLMDRYGGNEYITLFACIVDSDNGAMHYVNAGHPGPYLYRTNGKVERLASTQHMVGILPAGPDDFGAERLRLQPQDRLYLYSDGVTETFNDREENFGSRRLEAFLDRQGLVPLEDIPVQLEAELDGFRGQKALSDDMCFVAMEFHHKIGPVRGLLNLLGLDDQQTKA